MQTIAPCLWFDGKAEEAATFYTGVFARSRIDEIMRFTEAGPGPQGAVLSVRFQLDGQPFIALNLDSAVDRLASLGTPHRSWILRPRAGSSLG